MNIIVENLKSLQKHAEQLFVFLDPIIIQVKKQEELISKQQEVIKSQNDQIEQYKKLLGL